MVRHKPRHQGCSVSAIRVVYCHRCPILIGQCAVLIAKCPVLVGWGLHCRAGQSFLIHGVCSEHPPLKARHSLERRFTCFTDTDSPVGRHNKKNKIKNKYKCKQGCEINRLNALKDTTGENFVSQSGQGKRL